MNDDVILILKKVGAVLSDDHFVYTSGKHGSVYINKDALYPHTVQTSEVGKMMADKCLDLDVDVVAAPAIGGIILSQWCAYYLSLLKNKDILAVYTEKTIDKDQIFTRGYDQMVKDKNVLVIEDLTTTGGSVKKVVDSVRKAGGNVLCVCVMVNRDPELVTSESIGAPLRTLGILRADSSDESKCELCKKNIPVNTKIGHGKKFVEKINNK